MSRIAARLAAVIALVTAMGLVSAGCTPEAQVPRGGSTAAARSSPTTRPTAPPPTIAGPAGSPFRVAVADYDLGARAFTLSWFHGFDADGNVDPGIRAPLELTATVHFPVDGTADRHPLVVLEHGLWYSCADRAAEAAIDRAQQQIDRLSPPTDDPGAGTDPAVDRWQAVIDRDLDKLTGWPCRSGVPPLPSYRGYDYLATVLAAHGIIAVSVGENGVNNGDQGSADRARAAVANRHLAMWAQLDRTGGGPLAGRFTRPGTSDPVAVDFRDRVDLDRVGLVGHSRGGRGVMWEAADEHRGDLPSGVRIRAVATLAAAEIPNIEHGDPAERQYLTSDTPVLAWIGTCDGAVSGSGDYLTRMRGRTSADLVRLTVHGADHDYLNTQWSPGSGQVQAYDDASHPAGRPDRCFEGAARGTAADAHRPTVRQLTEQQERRVATTYVGGFLLQRLTGDEDANRLLDGATHPLKNVADVDAVLIRPTR